VPTSKHGLIVVEDNPFLRVVGVVLDPTTSTERHAASADFFAHDAPDFDACARPHRWTFPFPGEAGGNA
jgi:hypothetical protein